MKSPGILESQKIRNYGLDMARCLAIIMVLSIHSIESFLPRPVPYFGYMSLGGVDLFFSLSGFLIGRILLENFSRPNFNFRLITRFWMRRWLRTLPLYFIIYLAGLVLYNLLLFIPVAFDIRYLLFIHSLTGSPDFFFSESWSLSIEEWFYLVVPLSIYVLYQLTSVIAKKITVAKALVITAIVLIGIMIIVRQTTAPRGIYLYGALYRMDAISYGLLAAWLSTLKNTFTNLKSIQLIVSGLVVWLLAVATLKVPDVPDYIRFVYYPLCGIGTATFVAGLYYYQFRIKFSFVVFISRISYSIYIINHCLILIPIKLLTKDINPPLLPLIWLASLAVIISLSCLSFRFIEQPFLRLRPKTIDGISDHSPIPAIRK